MMRSYLWGGGGERERGSDTHAQVHFLPVSKCVTLFKIFLGNRARKEVAIDFCKVGNNSLFISSPREIWPPLESVLVTTGNGTWRSRAGCVQCFQLN
jgi:hypothetical protein